LQLYRDLIRALTPLAYATEVLGTESEPAGGAVYVLLKLLKDELKVIEEPMDTERDDENSDDEMNELLPRLPATLVLS